MKKRRIFLGCFAVTLLILLMFSFYQHKIKDPGSSADVKPHGEDDHHSNVVNDTAVSQPPALDPIEQMFSNPKASETVGVVAELLEHAGPEIIEVLAGRDPSLKLQYGEGGWTLMHIASYQCSEVMVKALHQQGKLNWDLEAKDGTTPLTIAAERKCLPVLEYWKSKKARFSIQDGRGVSALSILQQTKNDEKLERFLSSLEGKKPASSKFAKNTFYRKRSYPETVPTGGHFDIDLNVRPNETQETAEISEFAD